MDPQVTAISFHLFARGGVSGGLGPATFLRVARTLPTLCSHRLQRLIPPGGGDKGHFNKQKLEFQALWLVFQ